MLNPPRRRRIYLMRHAEAAYVQEDGSVTDNERRVALTPLGRIQARKQAGLLASVPFDRAICSGLPRTLETATLVLAGREAPPLETVPELEEVRPRRTLEPPPDPEAWLAEMANPWAAGETPEGRFLGGERFADFDARVHPAFDALVAADDWTHLLLVLHGAVNRSILNHVLNLPWQGRVSIEQDNACINIIDVDRNDNETANRYLIRAVNVTGYNLNKSGMVLTNMEQTAMRMEELLEPRAEGGAGPSA